MITLDKCRYPLRFYYHANRIVDINRLDAVCCVGQYASAGGGAGRLLLLEPMLSGGLEGPMVGAESCRCLSERVYLLG